MPLRMSDDDEQVSMFVDNIISANMRAAPIARSRLDRRLPNAANPIHESLMPMMMRRRTSARTQRED